MRLIDGKYLQTGMILVGEGTKDRTVTKVWFAGKVCWGMHVQTGGPHVECYHVNTKVRVK